MTKEQELLQEMEKAAQTFQNSAQDIEDLKAAVKANQVVIDQAAIMMKDSKNGNFTSKKSFGEAFAEKIEREFNDRAEEIKHFQNSRDAKISFELKAVGTMTNSGHLTGDGVASYGTRQGILPNQKVNFRDLIPYTQSPTGIYVSYRETGGEGAFDIQTEGQSKAQVDYDLSEVKTVSNYVAGLAVFSKQLMTHLPWLQNTLVRMLLRDFYKKENAYFYSTVASDATGSISSAETSDIKALIDWIMAQQDADFNSSFVIVKNSQKAALLKQLFDGGNYLGAGSVVGMPDGSINVAGVPIIGASWATEDKAMIIDTDFIERVETSSIRVEFSYEDGDNFKKNLVTARAECFEDLNLLRTDAHNYLDFGNVS